MSSTVASSTGWSDFLSLYTFTGEPVLVAMPSADKAPVIESQTDAQVVESVLTTLKSQFGSGNVPSAPISYLVTRWGLNPYARGTHSYYSGSENGSPADRLTLAEPIGASLVFAGEAIHALYPSSVYGAYLSGIDQAQRILDTMKFPGDTIGNATCAADCWGDGSVPFPSN